MSNMFENLNSDGLEDASDNLGGFSRKESGLYDATVKMAYVGNSKSSNAKSLNVVLDIDGQEYTESLWVTGKTGDNFYTSNGKKHPLMGFALVESLCIMTTNVPLSEQTIEDKVIELWDYEQKKKVPTNVPVITSLLGKQISVGILKQISNKTKKNDNTGKYEDLDESKEENIIDKFFHFGSKKTLAEAKKGGDIPEEKLFYTLWGEKNNGITRNKFKKVAGFAGGGSTGTGSPAADSNKSEALFD